MENYEVLSIAGEGSYGIVMKCKVKYSKKVVAIKKLIDIENDHYVRKMAFREIRILNVTKERRRLFIHLPHYEVTFFLYFFPHLLGRSYSTKI